MQSLGAIPPVRPVEDKMALKDIVCKDFRYEDIIPFQLDIVTRNKMDFFVPMTYEILDKEGIRLCYNLSDMDPIRRGMSFSEAPYIASMLIKGMRSTMDHYIFPSQYLLKEKLVFLCRDGKVRVSYVPVRSSDMPLKDPNKVIRKAVFQFLNEIYPLEDLNEYKKGEYKKQMAGDAGKTNGCETVKKVMEILADNRIGMETCMRRIEKMKEEVFSVDDLRNLDYEKRGIALYGNII